MRKDLTSQIRSYFDGKATLSKKELAKAIGNDFPHWSEATINIRISGLKKDGIVQNPSKGVYAISLKNDYHPEITLKLKKLHDTIKKQFPYVRFCVWDTHWLNEFMRHQPFRFYLVAEVEKEVMESVFNALSESYAKIFLNPDAVVYERYIANAEHPLIIKHLVSESPIQFVQKVSVPGLEKLLVDMLADTDLFGPQQHELDFIYAIANEKYNLNQGMIKRYASRRNREQELLDLINTIWAKKP